MFFIYNFRHSLLNLQTNCSRVCFRLNLDHTSLNNVISYELFIQSLTLFAYQNPRTMQKNKIQKVNHRSRSRHFLEQLAEMLQQGARDPFTHTHACYHTCIEKLAQKHKSCSRAQLKAPKSRLGPPRAVTNLQVRCNSSREPL